MVNKMLGVVQLSISSKNVSQFFYKMRNLYMSKGIYFFKIIQDKILSIRYKISCFNASVF